MKGKYYYYSPLKTDRAKERSCRKSQNDEEKENKMLEKEDVSEGGEMIERGVIAQRRPETLA